MPSIEDIDVDKVLVGLKHAAATAANEEELRIKASAILESEVISKLGITPGRYEYTFVSGGRSDALYGHVIIEYKTPGKLLKEPDVARAKEQLIGYIKKESEVEDRFRLFLGVILTDRIGFVRYDEKSKTWLLRGPYDLNRETVLRLVEAIRGLRRKKLAVDELLRDFGPKSDITVKMVGILYDKVMASKSPKVEALFNDWKRLFSQVCAYSPEKLKGLEAEYGISGSVDYSALLFAIHTYYALLMKLLAAEVAYLFGAGKWLKSYVAELEDANMKGLDVFKRSLEDLESGGVFRKLLNITNFIEGDYFSWYLEELDKEVADVIGDLAKGLADYEPATPVLEPEYTRDLLKRLYQNLVPKKIRHDLGEYYTPDWLAELLLNETGLTLSDFEKLAQRESDPTFPLNLRVLDPACGSGTFLLLAMKRLREYSEGHFLKDILAGYMLRNVVGFDLNPLAVLTARTNYLLSIADLLGYVKGPIEIPVYLADSLLIETRTTLTGVSYAVRTFVGIFELPKSLVDAGMLGKLLENIDRYVRRKYKLEEFLEIIREELDLHDKDLQLVKNLYRIFLKLEIEGRNHVWTSIIKNAFAPLTIVNSGGKFNCVIGNPPWINWESLPDDYRETSKDLWDSYGLLKGKGRGLGKVKREIASLFIARSLDKYVNDNGILTFLLPFTVFKNQSGAGFREFVAKGKPSNKLLCKTLRIYDLVTLYPFEGATNRTAMITIKRAGITEFPVECIIFHNPRSSGIDPELALSEVKASTRQFEMIFTPVDRGKPDSPWMQITSTAYEGIKKILGKSDYRAYAGVCTALNQVYWIEILDKIPDGVLIRNPVLPGQKKTVKIVEAAVEKDFAFPSVRGRDVKKWYVTKEHGWILLPHDQKTGRPLAERLMRLSYPKTYDYFDNFRGALEKRSIHMLWGKGKPFYSVYDIGDYTFYPFKVVWKEISGKISGKAEFLTSVVESGYHSIVGKKVIIPDHKLMLIPLERQDEAYYVSAILNSRIVALVMSAYAIETGMDPRVIEHVELARFESDNAIHQKLSQSSKEAHETVKQIYDEGKSGLQSKLKATEDEIDQLTSQLYGITDDELREIRKCSMILHEGDVEADDEIKSEIEELKVDFLKAVVSPKTYGNLEVSIINPKREEITVELKLPDGMVELKSHKEAEMVKVKVPPLQWGEHKVPYKIITPSKVTEGEFTLHVEEKKRFRKDESLTGKLDELLEES